MFDRCVVYYEGSDNIMLLFYLSAISNADGKRTLEYYYVTYRRQMFYAAHSVLRNERDAEDAVHNAFLGIAKHIDVLLDANEEDGKCYCIKAAKNAALNIARKNKSIPETVNSDDLYDLPDEKSLGDMLAHMEYEEILAAVKSMDDVYRDVLYLHYVMDMPVKQISDVLNRKMSTVKQQLVRGKKMLILKLTEEEVMTGYDK